MRKITGRIFQRGKSGYYYLQFYVNRKQIVQRLLDNNGMPIVSQKEAKKAAERVLHPVKASCKEEQLHQVLEAVETAEMKAERAFREYSERRKSQEEERKDAASSVAAGWELFMSCRCRPDSCRHQLQPHTTAWNYKAYYEHFSIWCKEQNPPIARLSELTGGMAEGYIETLRNKLSSGTVNKYLQFMRCLFDCLIKEEKVGFSSNPFSGIEREVNVYRSKRPFTNIEIDRILAVATGDLRLLCLLGLYTGLRFGDCCTLRWDEVDMENRIIQRIPRKTAGRIKDTASAKVKLGIPSVLLDALHEAGFSGSNDTYILPGFARLYLDGRSETVSRQVMDMFNKAGIRTTEEGGKQGRATVLAGFHSFRYTYISRHAEAGTPAAVIQKNAGHSNPAMTEHYTRISDDAARKYARALDNAMEPERDVLKKLAETLDIDTVRQLLALAHSKIKEN